MRLIQRMAPNGDEVIDYDRRHLALYAALLEADDAGGCWREAAANLMQLDVSSDDAERCWRSHLDRARWIVGEGLATALTTFSARQTATVTK